MNSPALFVVSALKAVVEIAGMCLIAQGLLGLISGDARHDNFIYRMFQIATAPLMKLARAVTPGFVKDAYLGLAGFFILFWLWVALVFAKVYVCHAQHLACLAK